MIVELQHCSVRWFPQCEALILLHSVRELKASWLMWCCLVLVDACDEESTLLHDLLKHGKLKFNC